ncbi:MAG: hypothetical protein AAF694_18655 [Bacteroidota bacterium]
MQSDPHSSIPRIPIPLPTFNFTYLFSAFFLLNSCNESAVTFKDVNPIRGKQRILVVNQTGNRTCESGIFITFTLSSENDQIDRILEPQQQDTAFLDIQANGQLGVEVSESRTGLVLAKSAIAFSERFGDPQLSQKVRTIRYCEEGRVTFVDF